MKKPAVAFKVREPVVLNQSSDHESSSQARERKEEINTAEDFSLEEEAKKMNTLRHDVLLLINSFHPYTDEQEDVMGMLLEVSAYAENLGFKVAKEIYDTCVCRLEVERCRIRDEVKIRSPKKTFAIKNCRLLLKPDPDADQIRIECVSSGLVALALLMVELRQMGLKHDSLPKMTDIRVLFRLEYSQMSFVLRKAKEHGLDGLVDALYPIAEQCALPREKPRCLDAERQDAERQRQLYENGQRIKEVKAINVLRADIQLLIDSLDINAWYANERQGLVEMLLKLAVSAESLGSDAARKAYDEYVRLVEVERRYIRKEGKIICSKEILRERVSEIQASPERQSLLDISQDSTSISFGDDDVSSDGFEDICNDDSDDVSFGGFEYTLKDDVPYADDVSFGGFEYTLKDDVPFGDFGYMLKDDVPPNDREYMLEQAQNVQQHDSKDVCDLGYVALLPYVKRCLSAAKEDQAVIQSLAYDDSDRLNTFKTLLQNATKQISKKNYQDGLMLSAIIFKCLVACQMLKDNVVFERELPGRMWVLLKGEMKQRGLVNADFETMKAFCNNRIKGLLLSVYKDILYSSAKEMQQDKHKIKFTLGTLFPLFLTAFSDKESLLCIRLVKHLLGGSLDNAFTKNEYKKLASQHVGFWFALNDAATSSENEPIFMANALRFLWKKAESHAVTFSRPKSTVLAWYGIYRKNAPRVSSCSEPQAFNAYIN